ncbi:MAG: hypothetical protein JNK53_02400 [Phycisphaerae bacterium]|nr:hypothetical protein [Phycisphaerae bacterium]
MRWTPFRSPALTSGCLMACLTGALLAIGCQTYPYDPAKATRAYPEQLKQEKVVDIQVIPDVGEGTLTIVNATPVTYANFDLWINRRYMRHVETLKAGQQLTLDIDSFWDERGEGPFPGGWLRYYQPTPIVLAQIQTAPDAPLIGLSATRPINVNR